MPLGFLAHQEALERQPAHAGHRDHGGGDRIGADGHAADGLGQRRAEQIQNPFGDQLGADESSVTCLPSR